MNSYDNKKALVEAALIAAITTIFAFSTIYLPLLSILIVLIPVPFMILAYRHGIKYSILSFITFSLLIGIVTEILYAGFLLLIFGPMTIIMGYYISKNKEPYVVVGLGAIAAILSIFVAFQLVFSISGINIIDEIAIVSKEIISTQVEMLKNMEVDVLSADQILNYLLMIIPVILIIQSLFISIGNYYLSLATLKRFNFNKVELPQFSTFRLPPNIVLGSFIIFILSYLTTYIEGIYHVSLITNVTLLFIFLFFLQGISVVSFLIKKTNIPKVVRIIVIGVILFIGPLLTAISFIGLVDSVVDIRKLKK